MERDVRSVPGKRKDSFREVQGTGIITENFLLPTAKNTSSAYTHSLFTRRNTCLYFSDDSSLEGVCLFGNALIHFDRNYKELLWNEGDKKYYPEGIDDNDYCVLEFIADRGRNYRYDGKGDLSRLEIELYDIGKEFENEYSKVANIDN